MRKYSILVLLLGAGVVYADAETTLSSAISSTSPFAVQSDNTCDVNGDNLTDITDVIVEAVTSSTITLESGALDGCSDIAWLQPGMLVDVSANSGDNVTVTLNAYFSPAVATDDIVLGSTDDLEPGVGGTQAMTVGTDGELSWSDASGNPVAWDFCVNNDGACSSTDDTMYFFVTRPAFNISEIFDTSAGWIVLDEDVAMDSIDFSALGSCVDNNGLGLDLIFSNSGTLPTGTTLTSAGVWSGTPTTEDETGVAITFFCQSESGLYATARQATVAVVNTVTMPTITGNTVSAANTTLESSYPWLAGEVSLTTRFSCSDAVDEDDIISQTPLAGTETDAFPELSVFVSTGPCGLASRIRFQIEPNPDGTINSAYPNDSKPGDPSPETGEVSFTSTGSEIDDTFGSTCRTQLTRANGAEGACSIQIYDTGTGTADDGVDYDVQTSLPATKNWADGVDGALTGECLDIDVLSAGDGGTVIFGLQSASGCAAASTANTYTLTINDVGGGGGSGGGEDAEAGVSVTTGEACPGIPTGAPDATFNSSSSFGTAYDAASCGDVLAASAGFTWNTDKTLAKACSAANPIYILGYSPNTEGIHEYTMTSPDARLTVTGDGHVLAGFHLTDTDDRLFYLNGSADSRVACNKIDNPDDNGGAIYVTNNGGNDRIEIDNNIITGGSTTGIAINVVVCDPTLASCTDMPEFGHIHHNTFQDHPNQAAPGNEAIKLGSDHAYIDSVTTFGGARRHIHWTVENNLFDGWNGEEEVISLKSGGNILRYNCVQDGVQGTFVNRSGYENLIYGNWLDEVREGFRIAGEDNVLAYNYVRSNIGGSGGGGAWRLHVGRYNNSNGRYSYIQGSGNVLRLNVLSKHTVMVEIANNATTATLDEFPQGNTHSDNAYYTDSLIGTNASGSYDADGASWTEAQFRANNTWGSNTVTASDFASTTCFNSSLFNGPDGTVTLPAGDYHPDAPETIPEPSWWD